MRLPHTTGLPDLIPPPGAPAPEERAAAGPPPCAAVTREVLGQLRDAVGAALEKAQANATTNGEGVGNAGYPVAATLGRDTVAAAHHDTVRLLDWVDQWGVPPGLVGYPSIAYGIYGYGREVIAQLHVARHWVTVNAVYNAKRGTAGVAVECVHLITAAIDLAEPIPPTRPGATSLPTVSRGGRNPLDARLGKAVPGDVLRWCTVVLRLVRSPVGTADGRSRRRRPLACGRQVGVVGVVVRAGVLAVTRVPWCQNA